MDEHFHQRHHALLGRLKQLRREHVMEVMRNGFAPAFAAWRHTTEQTKVEHIWRQNQTTGQAAKAMLAKDQAAVQKVSTALSFRAWQELLTRKWQTSTLVFQRLANDAAMELQMVFNAWRD